MSALKVVSWNIARRSSAWRYLLDTDADVARLQEAGKPPADVASRVGVDDEPWYTDFVGSKRKSRTAVVRLTDRCRVEWLTPTPLNDAVGGDLAVSRRGTLSAAAVYVGDADPVILASMYCAWEGVHRSARSRWIVADASAHRLASDLSLLVGRERGHRIVAAGDLNIMYGYGEKRSVYWAARYATFFARMAAIGLPFVGPQAPNGRQADPWPAELPPGSGNVPTFHPTQVGPAGASRQLDFVFASRDIADGVSVHALNSVEEWGPSDHCRIAIEVVL